MFKLLKQAYKDGLLKMEDTKIERLLHRYEHEGVSVFTKRIIKLLGDKTEISFSIAVEAVNRLYKLNCLNSASIENILEEVEASEISALWKLSFYLVVDIVDDNTWDAFTKALLDKLDDLEELRAVHSLCNKTFRRMGGKALNHYQPHTQKILELRKKLQARDFAINLKGKSAHVNTDIVPNAPFKVACIISSWPQKADSTHMGVVYLLKKLVTNDAPNNEFHLVVSGENETFSPFGRLTSLTEEIVDAQTKNWLKEGGVKEHLFSNIDITRDPATKNVKIIDAVNYVSSMKPDLLVYVGGPYESTFFRKLMFPYFPTCVVPTSIMGTPAPGLDGVVATSDEAAEKFKKRYKHITYRVPKPFMLFQNNHQYQGWFPTIHKDTIVLATVMGGNRIEKCLSELSDDELKGIASILLDNEKFIWILVGKTDMRKIEKLSSDFEYLIKNQRIFYIEYVTEIRSFLRKLDVFFVIPGMTGGGQGAQAAMFEKVAVVCPFVCDVAGVVPLQGKYSNIDECKDIFHELDKTNVLVQLKDACNASVNSNSVERVAGEWRKAMIEMTSAGLSRLQSEKVVNHALSVR